MPNPKELKRARKDAGLTAAEAARLVGVSAVTWQRWEGQTARKTEIHYAHWELFRLVTGTHPSLRVVARWRV
jgi:transcriptional regulator with XRE-family HTH domain